MKGSCSLSTTLLFPIRSESTTDFSQAAFSLLLWTIQAASSETDLEPNQVSGSPSTRMLSSLATAWSQPCHQSVCSFVVLETDVFALLETCRSAWCVQKKKSTIC